MRKLRSRLTYANVVSTLALFLALSGSAVLAAEKLGKNVVGPRQIKKNAVRTSEVKNYSLKTKDVATAFVAPQTSGLLRSGIATSSTLAANKAAPEDCKPGVGDVVETLVVGECKALGSIASFSFWARCLDDPVPAPRVVLYGTSSQPWRLSGEGLGSVDLPANEEREMINYAGEYTSIPVRDLAEQPQDDTSTKGITLNATSVGANYFGSPCAVKLGGIG